MLSYEGLVEVLSRLLWGSGVSRRFERCRSQVFFGGGCVMRALGFCSGWFSGLLQGEDVGF